MTPARWRDIAQICDSALSIDREARGAFLDQECAGDALLREEVASLLAYEEAARQFSGALALDVAAAALASGELPAAERFAPGSLIGPYRIVELLGAGGMGEVYRAADTRLDRDVALKFLPAELTNDAPALERFQREARAVSALNDPNICTLHDIGVHEYQPFLVLELLEGESVKQRLAAGPLNARETIETAVQICRGLEAAHAKGIVHRDVKPANVFITRGGQAKILDFGLAKLHSEPPGSADGLAAAASGGGGASGATATLPGRVMGTAAYMSPEQARGEAVDARSDVFSLGVTLYQMATGTLPFRGAAPDETAEDILPERPRPPREMNPALPSGLQRVILKALEKDRGARYQSAAEMCSELSDVQSRPGRRTGRRAALAALAAAVAVLLGGLLYFGLPRPGGGVKSLAVLPFDGPTDGSGGEYLAEGLTEALTAAAAMIRDLRVTSRTSVMRYKNSDVPPGEIARELKVDALVKGSVSASGDVLRTRVQLFDGEAGETLWAQSFEREFTDAVALQHEIAQVIAREIGAAVSPRERARLDKAGEAHREAFEAYYRGRHSWNKRTPEEIHKAIRWFQTAIDADPVFAPAYAGLADCYNQLGTVIVGEGPPSETRALAAAAARKALEIDNELAEAHAALAYADLYNWNWPQAEAGFRRAIELNPSYASARLWYAHYLSARGRFDEALLQVDLAQDLDPLSPIIQTQVGWILARAHRFEEALREYEKALELDPNHVWAYWQIGGAYSNLSRHEEAIAALEKAMELSGCNPAVAGSLGEAYAEAGRRTEALAILDELTAASRRRYVSPMAFVFLYVGLDDLDRVFEWLERCYEERNNGLAYLAVVPGWERVRADPRGRDLMRRIGFDGN